jgi:hypothetical protein
VVEEPTMAGRFQLAACNLWPEDVWLEGFEGVEAVPQAIGEAILRTSYIIAKAT